MNNLFRLSSRLSHKFRIIKFSFFLILAITLFWKCVSPPDYLGGNLIPPGDYYRIKIDTSFGLSAYTIPYDTVRAMKFSDAILGESFDVVFGRTKSSFLTQLRLSNLKHKYGTLPQLDSAFLFLRLKEKLGDEPINILVFELADSLSKDSTYNALGSIDGFLSPNPINKVKLTLPYKGDETILKIPLDEEWVLNKLILADTSIMATQKAFLEYMYGLLVTTTGSFENPAKGMYYFDYINADTKLAVYYRNQEQDTVSMVYNYMLDDNCVRFNHFTHDYSEIDPVIGIKFNDTINTQDTIFFLKGLGGARGLIRLDSINSWLDSMPVAINKAELRIEIEDNTVFPPDSLVDRLFIYHRENDKNIAILDYQLSTDTFGGKYNKSKKYYSINITYHLQGLLQNDNPNKVIYIEPQTAYRRANSTILRSGAHRLRMKLILTYTKY